LEKQRQSKQNLNLSNSREVSLSYRTDMHDIESKGSVILPAIGLPQVRRNQNQRQSLSYNPHQVIHQQSSIVANLDIRLDSQEQ